MAKETNLSFLMTVDGYEIYIEDAQRELYEQAADDDELTDFGVWIRVLFAEENDMFDRIRNLGERVFYTPHAIAYHHIADRKLTSEYFDELSYGVGISKRLRAEKYGTERELFADEKAKRRYTKVLALFYILTFRPQKAKWLVRMRNGISKGIFEK